MSDYNRPPITEAVIEIKFSEALEHDKFAKLKAGIGKKYPAAQDIAAFALEFEINNKSSSGRAQQQAIGHKFTTNDASQIAIIWPTSFTLSQLAPYPGWDDYFGRFQRDWKILKRQGTREIIRVGVRFINRIDVPATSDGVNPEDYLSVYPSLPDLLMDNHSFAIQTMSYLKDIDCKLVLNSALIPSPLIEHMSFVVDLDVSREVDVPQSDKSLFALLNQIRDKKNEIFESCITDKSRTLFQ